MEKNEGISTSGFSFAFIRGSLASLLYHTSAETSRRAVSYKTRFLVQERVLLLFCADRGVRAVPGEHARVIGQCQQV